MSYKSEIKACVDCGETAGGGEIFAQRHATENNGKQVEVLVLKRRCWGCSAKRAELVKP